MIEWYRKRKRAELLGRAHTGYWHDPETGDTWQAGHRYALFTVPSSSDTPEGIAQMCHLVHLCDLTEQGEKYLPEKYATQR